MKKLVFLFLFFSLTIFSAASSLNKPDGYILDDAGILSQDVKNYLNKVAYNLESKTSAEIAVATIKSLDGKSIEECAVKLFEDWKIGKKGKDNGVLLLISKNDRALRIEVGYGLEGSLTDAKCSEIIRNKIVPHFRRNDFNGGIDEGFINIVRIIAKEYNLDEKELSEDFSEKYSDDEVLANKIAAVVGILIILIIMFFRIFTNAFSVGGGFRGGGRGGFGGGNFGGGFGGGRSGGGGSSGSW